MCKFDVRDDGPGIRPEERHHIFDPFYSARQAGRGLGLGLSKAWRIITNHGGQIEVESEPGHGATFTIVLPVQAREAPDTRRGARCPVNGLTDGESSKPPLVNASLDGGEKRAGQEPVFFWPPRTWIAAGRVYNYRR